MAGEGPEQLHLTLKVALLWATAGLEASAANSSTLSNYSGLACCLGKTHGTSYHVRIRLTRRWQNEQTKQARRGLSRAEDVLLPAFGRRVCRPGVVGWQHRAQASWPGQPRAGQPERKPPARGLGADQASEGRVLPVQHVASQAGSCERWSPSRPPCSCLVIASPGECLRRCARSLPWDLTVLISAAAHRSEPRC